jgi:hypothetical protein
MVSYAMNRDAAKQADNFGNFLDETGKYKGQFIMAEAVTSKKNTIGIEFTFRADDGREANYLTLWTHNADGKELQGFKVLNAILVCMRVPNIESQQRQIDKYDAAARGKVKVVADVFPDLMNKPIGLLLQKEAYQKNNGGVGHKLNIVAAFEANTELMSSELLAKKSTPEQLGKLVARLADKPLKTTAAQTNGDFYAEYDSAAGAPGQFDDIDF